MQLTGNTILVTGGGSGIGRGLAESLHQLGNQIVIAARRPDALANTTKANPGLVSLSLDVNDPEAIRAFAVRVTTEYPMLNVLINNAGIMKAENLRNLPAHQCFFRPGFCALASHRDLQRNQGRSSFVYGFPARTTSGHTSGSYRNHPSRGRYRPDHGPDPK